MNKKIILALGIFITSCTLLLATENVKNIKKGIKQGKASYYGGKFHKRMTASGKVYNKHGLTAAVPIVNGKPTMPFGTKVKVVNVKNNKEVIVIINDTGGFAKYNRVLDLSEGAMRKLGGIKDGVIEIEYEIIQDTLCC